MANDLNLAAIGRYKPERTSPPGQKVPGESARAFSDALKSALDGVGSPSPPEVLAERATAGEGRPFSPGGILGRPLPPEEGERGPLPGIPSATRHTPARGYRDALPNPGPGPGGPAPQPGAPGSLREQIQKYKEDQLLSSPGGDHYFLDRTSRVIDRDHDHSQLTNRVGKDLKDASQNFLNIFRDLGAGSTHKYLDRNGKIQEARDRGVLSHLKGFFQEVGGALKPEGSFTLAGLPARVGGFFKRLLFDAIGKELVAGVTHSAINMAKDAALAGLNLAEVVPDATLGNTEIGRQATTELFDDLQVLVSYGTDILPTKDAWERVYSPGSSDEGRAVPLRYNVTTPEQDLSDLRWREVRNTPFRKAIETVGALASRLLVGSLFPWGTWGGSRKRVS
ncbi:MAG: hypothetical protein HYY20_01330 [Candidatus Tectomicrobia bacterium]|uniref:Uncharacterized protein n=1 Tax=Tectimicrobiota bacterium TaxID=2528274 RepID=A0A932FVM0_UNCTE|nr:hypothetical protein [Candidatus Tectomicrobia bacterium]